MTPLTSTCRLAKVGAVIAGRKTASSGRISGDRVGIGANLARRWLGNCPLNEALLPSYPPSKEPKSRRDTRYGIRDTGYEMRDGACPCVLACPLSRMLYLVVRIAYPASRIAHRASRIRGRKET